jgi:hypothetical protein
MSPPNGNRPGEGAARSVASRFNGSENTRPSGTTQAPDAAIADAFEQELAEVISAAICQASAASGLRTGATADALLTVLAITLAMSPSVVRSPTTRRRTIDRLAKLLRRRVAAALVSRSTGDRP